MWPGVGRVTMRRMTDDHADGGADLTALAAFLHDDPPASMAALDQQVVDDLLAHALAAKEAQAEEISRAIDDSLRLVPRPLRGMVKRVLT